MKHLLGAAALAAGFMSTLALGAGLSITIGDPDFYGRLNLGGFPQPQLIYQQPVIIQQVTANRPPIYLRVPPGQAKNWRKHCHKYHACDEPVYFVQDSWYRQAYAPQYQGHEGKQKSDSGGHKNAKHKSHGNNGHGKGHH